MRFVKAQLWLLLYLVVQSVVMFGMLVYKINVDDVFAYELADGLMAGVGGGNIVARSLETMQALSMQLSVILIPTCIISGITIVIFYLVIKWKSACNQKLSMQDAIKYIMYALVVNLFISILVEAIPQTLVTNHQVTTDIALSGSFFMVLLSTGILVPIMEEIIFRYGIGVTIGGRTGLIYQAVVFGLLHGNIIQIIYAFGLGLWFGVENIKKNSLLPGIIMHITFNASTVVMSQLLSRVS